MRTNVACARVRELVDDTGRPTVFVAHDPDEFGDLADQALLAEHGRIETIDTIDTIATTATIDTTDEVGLVSARLDAVADRCRRDLP